jgi:(R,R)-butanediol dehydrogenase/meso-butanediol dehydrogenase/diacetyl reductase
VTPGPVAETMSAAIYRQKGELEVAEVAVPSPGPGQVLIEVSHCGVCGTDLHMVMDGWGRPGSIGGHEYSGVIAAVGTPDSGSDEADAGDDGRPDWKLGDRVVASPASTCGSCRYCRAGRNSLCVGAARPGAEAAPGAFASYVTAPSAQLFEVPAELSLREAALAEPLAVALHAVTRADVVTSDRVMISGAGPIGALALAVLVHRGVTDIVVSEPGVARTQLARSLGAQEVRHPDELDVFNIAEPGRISDQAVDVILECSGHRSAMESALCQLDRAGRLVVVGSGMEPPVFDPNRILLNELTVTGSYNYDDDGFEQALSLLTSGELPTELLIHAADIMLSEMMTAMQSLVAGRIPGKVMVAPGDLESEGAQRRRDG